MGTEACSLPLAHDYPELLRASQSKPALAVPGGLHLLRGSRRQLERKLRLGVLAQSLMDQQAIVG